MAKNITLSTIQLKRGPATNWSTSNPVLKLGEPGVEIDTYRLKIGDGVTAWNSLPYVNASLMDEKITAALADLDLDAETLAALQELSETLDLSAYATKEWVEDQDYLKILPNVDDQSDPGYGYPYWIPYNFEFTPEADSVELTLHTLTLDNNLSKMDFNKSIPTATTEVAGFMSAADKTSLAGKQDQLTAGTNINIANDGTISATDTKYTITIDV